MVFNSEHRKCTRISSDTTEKEDGEAEVEKGISEEELIEMMHFAQVMRKKPIPENQGNPSKKGKKAEPSQEQVNEQEKPKIQ